VQGGLDHVSATRGPAASLVTNVRAIDEARRKSNASGRSEIVSRPSGSAAYRSPPPPPTPHPPRLQSRVESNSARGFREKSFAEGVVSNREVYAATMAARRTFVRPNPYLGRGYEKKP